MNQVCKLHTIENSMSISVINSTLNNRGSTLQFAGDSIMSGAGLERLVIDATGELSHYST